MNSLVMEKSGFVSRIHRKKPKGRPLPEAARRANNIKSKVCSRVEHVFVAQKSRMGCSSEPLASQAPRRRSAWPTSSTI